MLEGRDLCDHLRQTDVTGSTCLFPNALLKASDGLGGDAPPRFPFAGEAESEKLSLLPSGHCALRLIYLRFELVRDPARLIPAARQSRFTIAPASPAS